jgi:hypothetical protein
VRQSIAATAFRADRLVLKLAFDAARGTLAQQPLALAVPHAIHRRAAGIATVRSGRTWRFPHRFITTGAVAKNRRMLLCCVTTRRGGSGRQRRPLLRLALASLTFASLPFRLGMLSASFSIRAVLLLTLGRLPAAQLLPAFGGLAIALVLPPGLESPPAAFAKTRSPPQSPAPGGYAALVGMLNLSHGRLRLPGAARGGSLLSSSGTLPLLHCPLLSPSVGSLSAASRGNRKLHNEQDRQDVSIRQAVPQRRKQGRGRSR